MAKKQRKHNHGKSVVSSNNKYRDRRAQRKKAAARAKFGIKGAVVGKLGDKAKAALGAAAEGIAVIKPGYHPARLAQVRKTVHRAVESYPPSEERAELQREVAENTDAGLQSSDVLEKIAQGQRVTREEEKQAANDSAEIMENLVETVKDSADTLAYKSPKWDANSAQVFAALSAIQELTATVDAQGKALQINGLIPEDGQQADPGTLTYFTDDGRRISLKELVIAGMYVRTLAPVKGAAIRFDSSAKKAFIDTDAVVMQMHDSTLPTRGTSWHDVVFHTTKELWTAYATTVKADALEDTRPYGFEPHSYAHQEYPVNENRRYHILGYVPSTRDGGGAIVIGWPTTGPWIRSSASLLQANDAAGNIQQNVAHNTVECCLNFAEKDAKATHKDTILQLIPNLDELITAGFVFRVRVEITRFTQMRMTPTMDSHVKELTRQLFSLLGNTSGQRDIAQLFSLIGVGPIWDVLAQSDNAAASFTTITELFGTPAETAPTKRALKS